MKTPDRAIRGKIGCFFLSKRFLRIVIGDIEIWKKGCSMKKSRIMD